MLAVRPAWAETMFDLAHVWAQRASCLRLHVGVVLVNDAHQVLAAGYNGSLRGAPHCDDAGVGCLIVDGHCVRTIHAETNALAQAARNGTSLLGARAYVTATPCLTCAKALVQAGVVEIHYWQDYASQGATALRDVLADAGVPLIGPCALQR